MSKSTRICYPTAVKCAICRQEHEPAKMLVHLMTHHAGALQIGEIVWLNKHEAIFAGKHYRART